MRKNLGIIFTTVILYSFMILSVHANVTVMPSELSITSSSIQFNDITTNGTISVAVGEPGFVLVSNDRINWEKVDFPTSAMPVKVFWNGEKFVIMARSTILQKAALFTSPNGIEWDIVYYDDQLTFAKYGFTETDDKGSIHYFVKGDAEGNTYFTPETIEPAHIEHNKIKQIYKFENMYFGFGDARIDDETGVVTTILHKSESALLKNPIGAFYHARAMDYRDGKYYVYSMDLKEENYVSDTCTVTITTSVSEDLTNWQDHFFEFTTSHYPSCVLSIKDGVIHVNYLGLLKEGRDNSMYDDYVYRNQKGEIISEDGIHFYKTGRKAGGDSYHPVLFDDGGQLMIGRQNIYYAEAGQNFQTVYTEIGDSDYLYQKGISDSHWTGKEWITRPLLNVANSNKLQLGQDLEQNIRGNSPAPQNVKSEYLYTWTGNGYLEYNPMLDRDIKPDKVSEVRVLDENFEPTPQTAHVPGYVQKMTYNNGIYYAQTIDEGSADNQHLYYSVDLELWNPVSGQRSTPLSLNLNSEHCIIPLVEPKVNSSSFGRLDGQTWLSYSRSGSSLPIVYEAMSPTTAGMTQQYFYAVSEDENGYQTVTTLWLSLDGIYWNGVQLPNNISKVKEVYEIGDKLAVKCGYETEVTVLFDKEQVYSFASENTPVEPIYIQANGKMLGFKTPPTSENDRTLVPMRFLFEQLGAEVNWNPETQTATASKNDAVISFSIDDTAAVVNSDIVSMDVPARLIGDKTMVPLRFLSENLGYEVSWDPETNTAIIQ